MANTTENIPDNALKLISGLAILTLEEGKGEGKPGSQDQVEITLKEFPDDKSSTEAVQFTIGVSELNPGLSETVQLMVPGQKAKVWVPNHLNTKASIKADQTYHLYEIRLISFKRLKDPPKFDDKLISPSKKQ